MTYQALYRRWRPQAFAGLAGQEHITRILQNALEQGCVAHAYLFCGPRGTGKTSAAKILAKAVNCENGPSREPCNRCPSCLGIQDGRVMDVLEIDAASNRGIDEIRDLREKVRYAATEVRRKVYIIDEVHMLTPEAFNALLKTLEEPPAQVLFILATTEPHKLPPTIVSRCQRLDFRLIGTQEIVERLRFVAADAGRNVSESALQLIAEEAAGAMRDALSLLEQVFVFAGGDVSEEDVLAVCGSVSRNVFYDLTAALLSGDLSAALRIVHEVVTSGRDLHHFTQQAIAYYRDLMVVLACRDDVEALGIAPEWALRLKGQAEALGMGRVGHVLSVLHGLLGEVRWAARPRLLWELALFRIFGLDTQRNAGQPVRPAKGTGASVYGALQADSASIVKTNSQGYAGHVEEDLHRLSRLWPKVLEQVKQASIRTHAVLLDCRLLSFNGGVLELGFPSDFHKETMEETQNRRILANALRITCGSVPEIRCTLQDLPKSRAARAEFGQDELINSAAEIFRGQIIDDTNIY